MKASFLTCSLCALTAVLGLLSGCQSQEQSTTSSESAVTAEQQGLDGYVLAPGLAHQLEVREKGGLRAGWLLADDAPGQVTLRLVLENQPHSLRIVLSANETQVFADDKPLDLSAEIPSWAEPQLRLVQGALGSPTLRGHLSGASFLGEKALAIGTRCMVTGCSGEVCASRPVMTTCQYKPEYACLKYSRCGAYGTGGACGWQKTAAYLQCLAEITNPPQPVCQPADCGPQLGMPNYLCPDGVTYAGPTGVCKPTASGTCGWEVISCPTTDCGCTTNADCVKTVSGCCPCSSGGREIAVARQCLSSVPGCTNPGQVACMDVYLCTGAQAVCQAGKCVLSGGAVSVEAQ